MTLVCFIFTLLCQGCRQQLMGPWGLRLLPLQARIDGEAV